MARSSADNCCWAACLDTPSTSPICVHDRPSALGPRSLDIAIHDLISALAQLPGDPHGGAQALKR
jgi:hypothetical protein